MAPPIDHPLDPPPGGVVEVATAREGVAVRGALPDAMSGWLLGVQRGVVHAVRLDGGRMPVYRSHRLRPATRTPGPASEIIVFGGSILVLGDGSPTHRLSADLGTLTAVDLAGRSRRLVGRPKRDPDTGDLHLLATAPDGSQEHVVVSSGALMRRSRPIVDPPARVEDLAIAGDRLLLASAGHLGLGSRDLVAPVRWIATGGGAPSLVHARPTDETVVVYTTTPALERWTIDPTSSRMRREVLEPTPRRFARTNHGGGTARPLLWTIGDRAMVAHDLVTGHRSRRRFGRRQPGDFAFVAGPAEPVDSAAGWLVGFVHDASAADAELVVLDAADLSRPAVAAFGIPGPIPADLRTAWIPDSARRSRQPSPQPSPPQPSRQPSRRGDRP